MTIQGMTLEVSTAKAEKIADEFLAALKTPESSDEEVKVEICEARQRREDDDPASIIFAFVEGKEDGDRSALFTKFLKDKHKKVKFTL